MPHLLRLLLSLLEDVPRHHALAVDGWAVANGLADRFVVDARVERRERCLEARVAQIRVQLIVESAKALRHSAAVARLEQSPIDLLELVRRGESVSADCTDGSQRWLQSMM